jgi:glycosyltransferase involved in cell wall biosynthesis
MSNARFVRKRFFKADQKDFLIQHKCNKFAPDISDILREEVKKRTIAVNTRLLMPGKLDGIGWFTFETLRRISKSHPEVHFYFLFDRKYSPEVIFGDNVTPVVLGPPTRHPILWFFWLEFRVASFLRRVKPDIFLSTDGFLPLRSKVPSVQVIHDLNFEHRPGDLPYLARKYYRYFFPRFARKASRIVTVSEYSRRDIINQYDIKEELVDLAYNGVNEQFKALSPEQALEVRNEFTQACPYFIFVGSLHPRKNITNLLKAFQLFKDENKANFKLVLVGEKFFLTSPMEEQLEKMPNKKDVIFTNRLAPDRLNAVTSLPEIAGDAAIYASPESPGSIRDAMIRIVREKGLREELIEKGRKRGSLFSWDNTASELWDSIEKVIRKNA